MWEHNKIRQENGMITAVETDCGRRFVFLNVFIVPIRFADDIFDNCNNIGLLTTFYLEHLTLCELIVVKDRVMSSYQHKYGKIIIINICRGQREK